MSETSHKMSSLITSWLITSLCLFGAGATQAQELTDTMEFIVKPREGVAPVEVFSDGKTDWVAGYLSELGHTADAPLTFKAVTSGRELLISLNRADLAGQIATRVEEHPALTVSGDRRQFPLKVRATESADAGTVILNDLFPQYQLIIEQTEDHLAVSVDFDVLGSAMVDKLKGRADIEYVQSNFRVVPFK